MSAGHAMREIARVPGITTAVPPNTRVTTNLAVRNSNSAAQPFDWVSWDENNGGATYASLAASSYHSGGVNALFGDGSVKFVKDTIAPRNWRNLGTIAGNEIVSGTDF